MLNNLREWIGTLGTLAALGWAVFLYWRSLQDKKMDQARLVSVVPLEPEVIGVGDVFEIPFGHGNVGGTTSHEFVEVRHGEVEVSVSRATKQLTVRRLEIINQSSEVLSDVVAEMADGAGNALGSVAHAVYLRAGEHHKFTFFMEREVGHWFSDDKALRIVAAFTDNLGTRWSKTVGGPLKRVSGDYSGLDLP